MLDNKFKNAKKLVIWYILVKMWILLMIIFSGPYEVGKVDILGNYQTKPECVEEIQRALTFEVPKQTSFGCVKIERIREANKSL